MSKERQDFTRFFLRYHSLRSILKSHAEREEEEVKDVGDAKLLPKRQPLMTMPYDAFLAEVLTKMNLFRCDKKSDQVKKQYATNSITRIISFISDSKPPQCFLTGCVIKHSHDEKKAGNMHTSS
jgi:hypothetical protein